MRYIISIILILFARSFVYSQTCSGLGQNPGSAFPVCGVQSFSQATVPRCGGAFIPSPCNDGALETDINPYWYKFKCFQSGTLGFLITPNDLSDDYDWQIFDVTGKPVNDVYTDKSMFVVCNWSGNAGVTGTRSNALGLVNCGGYSYSPFSAMPNLIKDHEYLLLISHFTPSQSGYKLDFGGGTALITDTTKPGIQKLTPLCSGRELVVKLNKKMQCSSLATDGSDFIINNNPGVIVNANAPGCAAAFDMDSIVLSLNNPLDPGNYTLMVKNGTDGNTLLDPCATSLEVGKSVDFNILPPHPAEIDTITFSKCPPGSISVTFDQAIQCISVDPDGSDFFISGPVPVSIASVEANCDAGNSSMVLNIFFSAPINTPGDYQLHIKKGKDGNTLLGLCGDEVLPLTKAFHLPPTVFADINYTLSGNCKADTFTFTNNGGGAVTSWTWTVNGQPFGNTPVVKKILLTGNKYDIKLQVSNNGCSDEKDSILTLQKVKASFSVEGNVCPTDTVSVLNSSEGLITDYFWNFGNGSFSNQKDPPPTTYPTLNKTKIYDISLKVISAFCTDTISHKINVLSGCYIDVPNSFTPNNDGLNDFFYPLNALKATGLSFTVYDRWGTKVFESHDWQKKWDGTYKGVPQDAGTYVYILSYTNKDSGKNVFKKGTVMLIR